MQLLKNPILLQLLVEADQKLCGLSIARD